MIDVLQTISLCFKRVGSKLLVACIAQSSVFASTALAANLKPLPVTLTLSHIAPELWRADYEFSQAITALDLGEKVGTYRREVWRPIGSNLQLIEQGDHEVLQSQTPTRHMSVEIRAYGTYEEKNYAPNIAFSDGAHDFYVGFLFGTSTQQGKPKSLAFHMQFKGLENETVIAPTRLNDELEGYAYFGAAKPARMGKVDVILDPAMPPWMRESLNEIAAKTTDYYAAAFHRPLKKVPLITFGIVDMEGKPGSFSIKGGAIGGDIAIRLEGGGIKTDSPKKKILLKRLLAHELAHLWQQNVERGGIGEGEDWIHEGGAEAIMLAALRDTGIITQQDADTTEKALLAECDKLQNVSTYRGIYSCGFKRFHDFSIPPVQLWRLMMDKTEATGDKYSEKMIRSILQ